MQEKNVKVIYPFSRGQSGGKSLQDEFIGFVVLLFRMTSGFSKVSLASRKFLFFPSFHDYHPPPPPYAPLLALSLHSSATSDRDAPTQRNFLAVCKKGWEVDFCLPRKQRPNTNL